MPLISRIQKLGDALYAYGNDGTVTMFTPSTSGVYLPTSQSGVVTPPPTIPPVAGLDRQNAMLAWLAGHIGAFVYSQASGRLNPLVNGYTDCSALMWYLYKNVISTPIDIGTWTGTQHSSGTVIQDVSGTPLIESNMVIGDLVFFDWNSYTAAYDHVEMYIGSNQICGHGGPGNGPTVKSLSANVARAGRARVCRYI